MSAAMSCCCDPSSSSNPSRGFRPVLVTAPGKVILHGEHAVVYGNPAVAAAVGIRSRLAVAPSAAPTPAVEVSFDDVGIRGHRWSLSAVRRGLFERRPPREALLAGSPDFQEVIWRFLDRSEEGLQTTSLLCFLYLYCSVLDDPVPMRVSAESDIPIGAGLGSSAALSVCLAAGLLAVRDRDGEVDRDEINRLAHVSEKIIHGPKASGLDNTVSTFGGTVVFSRGTGMTRLPRSPPLRVLLVDTSVSRSTKALVEKVAARLGQEPEVVGPMLSAVGGISQRCVGVLEAMAEARERGENGEAEGEHYQELGRLIDHNQDLLESMEVSHPALEEIVGIARRHGLHGKLTGAGGGGFAFVLLPPSAGRGAVEAAKAAYDEAGLRCWETSLEPQGVTVVREAPEEANGH